MHRSRLLLVLVLAAPALAQNVLFEERFDTGIPATWIQLQGGWTGDRWLPGIHPVTGNRDAWHEYFCAHGSFFRDNILVTPPIDLRGLNNATLTWDDYQVFPTSRMLNQVRVSVAGAAWVAVHTITTTQSGASTISVPLDQFAGQAPVNIGFHYKGYIANEWRIDNVRVTTTQPVHTIDGLASPGTATFAVRGATPGRVVLMGLSFHGAGPTPTPFGPVLLGLPISLQPIQIAGPGGTVSETKTIPAGFTGLQLWGQGAELQLDNTVRWTNLVQRVVL